MTQELKLKWLYYKPKVSIKYLLEKRIERKEPESGCYLGMVVLDRINVHFR